jgi:nicotinate dehydrogenase subunit A
MRPSMPTYRCRLNGRAATLASWDPATPLLYALRETGLHSAKIGCGLGQCGTCTVLVNGEPARACVTPVSGVAGKAILTVEGLGTAAKPDPLQAAFVAEGAAQCGYCTSGMIMSATALLARTPHPTIEQVKDALAGNLCRCGAYPRILKAVVRAGRAGR